ncbi:MAG: epimerase [Puniceicoccaceae bacterium]|nr:epimerase [Puniceicoccaceae bacterium]
MNILLTGCAGFIGSHTAERLLQLGHRVIGVDNFDPFYSRAIKNENLAAVDSEQFELIEADLADIATYQKIAFMTEGNSYDAIIHLAAKAGVRPSIEDPLGYQRANVIATQNLLEYAKEQSIKQFVFASSSSVYGANPRLPWKEKDSVLMPISPYASNKVSCELMGHVYSKLYGIRFLGLRFFTVYGPRQRPDLAISKFIRLISQGKPIPVFGDGATCRDYTYIDDIVDGIIRALHFKSSDYELLNLGNEQMVSLSEMIKIIESAVGKKAIIDLQPKQPGDVLRTWADLKKVSKLLNFQSKTDFKEGIKKQVEFYASRTKAFYG